MAEYISKELIIVGAGPAGLKAAEEAGRHGIDYIVIERGAIGQAWREIRPEMPFLSPCHPQRDWTSLSSKFPIWKMPVRRPYCTAEQFITYLDAFQDHFKLNLSLNNAVNNINHDGEQYLVSTQQEKHYSAPVLLMATGIFGNPFIPPIPGVEGNPYVMHSHDYEGPDKFRNQAVLIVGAGNSAAEVAIDLAGHSMVYMVSRTDLQYFSDTKKLYHIRGISESFLNELISMEIIRYRAFQEIQKIEGNLVYFKDWKLQVSKIIFATGYHAHLGIMNKFKLRVNKKMYPEVSYSGESVQYPNLFFGGPLSFQSTASIVIHGFIRNIPATIERIAERLKSEDRHFLELDNNKPAL